MPAKKTLGIIPGLILLPTFAFANDYYVTIKNDYPYSSTKNEFYIYYPNEPRCDIDTFTKASAPPFYEEIANNNSASKTVALEPNANVCFMYKRTYTLGYNGEEPNNEVSYSFSTLKHVNKISTEDFNINATLSEEFEFLFPNATVLEVKVTNEGKNYDLRFYQPYDANTPCSKKFGAIASDLFAIGSNQTIDVVTDPSYFVDETGVSVPTLCLRVSRLKVPSSNGPFEMEANCSLLIHDSEDVKRVGC